MLALAAFSLPVFAHSTTTIDDGKLLFRTNTKGKILEYRLVNLQKMATTVTLQSLYGNVQYFQRQITNHNGFTQSLDLESLAEGRYKLVVKNGQGTFSKVIKVEDDHVFISN